MLIWHILEHTAANTWKLYGVTHTGRKLCSVTHTGRKLCSVTNTSRKL